MRTTRAPLLRSMPAREVAGAVRSSASLPVRAGIILVFTVPMVRVYIDGDPLVSFG